MKQNARKKYIKEHDNYMGQFLFVTTYKFFFIVYSIHKILATYVRNKKNMRFNDVS